MNIFAVNPCPLLSAEHLGDKHVVKMVLESAQILSTVHHVLDSDVDKSKLYKPTHANHPCTVWARSHYNNYEWLWKHALWLCKEYNFRYDKRHKSVDMIIDFLEPKNIHRFIPSSIEDNGKHWGTPFPKAMPDEYKKIRDPILAYQVYYYQEKYKTGIAQYNKTRQKPFWIEHMEKIEEFNKTCED